jgi:hypothetical protein
MGCISCKTKYKPDTEITLYIDCPDGSHTVKISACHTGYDLVLLLENRLQLKDCDLTLVFSDIVLTTEKSLSQAGIVDGAKLSLTVTRQIHTPFRNLIRSPSYLNALTQYFQVLAQRKVIRVRSKGRAPCM